MMERRPAVSPLESIESIHKLLSVARDRQLQVATPGSVRYQKGLEKALAQSNAMLLSQPPVSELDPSVIVTSTATGFVGEVHSHSNPIDRDTVIYYLHGGAYLGGSASLYQGLCKQLCARTGLSVYALDYPLSPKHKFPEAQMVAIDNFRKLSKQFKRVIVMGDSAGGNLSLSLALKLLQDDKDLFLRVVVGMVVISPWIDLTHSGDSIKSRADVDPMIHNDFLPASARQFVSDEKLLSDPLVSPVFASKELLWQLPSLLIHVGDYELLLDDSVRLAQKCDPSKTRMVIWEKMHHVHQLTLGLLAEAENSLAEISVFVGKLAVPKSKL